MSMKLAIAFLGVLCASVVSLRAQAPPQVPRWWAAQSAPVPGLVGWWKLSGNTTDYSVTAANGTAVGSPYYTNGVLDSAIYLNGSSQWVTVPTNALTTTSGAVSAWVRPNSAALGIVFSASGEADVSHNVRLELSTSGGVEIVSNNSASAVNASVLASSAIPLGVWTHVVWVSTGSAYLLYTNGVAAAFTVSQGSNNGLWFGGVSGLQNGRIGVLTRTSTVAHFAGAIDDVRLYNRALTAGEVQKLWNGGRGTYY